MIFLTSEKANQDFVETRKKLTEVASSRGQGGRSCAGARGP